MWLSPERFLLHLLDKSRHKRILALDYGVKRIGTAVCDDDWIGATPGPVISSWNRPIERIRSDVEALIEEHQVGGVVVGWPGLPQSGKPTASCIRVVNFMKELGLERYPKTFFDESYSTAIAQERLFFSVVDNDERMGRKSKRSKLKDTTWDSQAAAVILDEFIRQCVPRK